MAKRNPFEQFANSFIRQLGRESAHTFYGDVTGKNTSIETIQGAEKFVDVPSVGDYIGWVFAIGLFAPIAAIYLLVKGIGNIVSKNMRYYIKDTDVIYKQDRRYRTGVRAIGKREVKRRYKFVKKDCPENDVKKFESQGFIYILMALLAIGYGYYMYTVITGNTLKNKAQMEAMTSWTEGQIEGTFDETPSIQFILGRVDGEVNKEVAIIDEKGEYNLCYGYYQRVPSEYVFGEGNYVTLPFRLDGELGTIHNLRSDKTKKLSCDKKEFSFEYSVPIEKFIGDTLEIKMNEKIYKFNIKKEETNADI